MGKDVSVRKTSKITFVVYGIIILLIIIACLFVGSAMDYAVNPYGKIDINLMGNGFNRVLSNPDLLLSSLKNKNGYAPKMLFLGVASTALYVLYKYSEEKKRFHRRGVEHGSAKWGDEKEMKSLADKGNPEFKPVLSADGKRVFDDKNNFIGVNIDKNIILSKEVKLSTNSEQHLLNLNVLIIGGSGSGKTRFYAKPNIMQLNTSYVVTDPKGEILQSTGKMLKEAGYEVRVLNLIQMEHSNNYNPFHYVYDYNGNLSQDNIKKMINVLFKATKGDGEKEDFWSQKGQSLLEAITFLLFEESEYNAKFDENGKIIPETRDISHLNFFSVTEKMRKLQYPPSGSKKPDGFFLEKNDDESEEEFNERRSKAFLCPLDKDFIELERRKGDTLAGRLYKEVRNAPEETGQSFLSSANVKTFTFNLDNVMNLTCCDNIKLETLGDRKTALFLIIPALDRTYNFIVAMLYTQMFDVLSTRANFKYKGKLPVHIRCIMDEFANIGQIPDFDQVISFVRSTGMSLNIIIQSLSQLKSRYEKIWETITSNCDSFLFLGGREESTLKSLSESLGKETIDIKGYNRTKGKSPSTSENNSIIGRELMQPNEIETMPISDCIVRVRSHNPFYCTKYPIEKHPNYKFLEDYDKENAFDINTVHAVTLKDFSKQNSKGKNTVTEKTMQEQEKKIETVFSKKDVPELEFETYEEAEMFAEEVNSEDFSEVYTDNDNSSNFGDVSDFESLELGEPVILRKEVNEIEDKDDSVSEKSNITDNDDIKSYYEQPDEDAETIDDVENMIEESLTDTSEFYCDSLLITNEDEYGFFDEA